MCACFYIREMCVPHVFVVMACSNCFVMCLNVSVSGEGVLIGCFVCCTCLFVVACCVWFGVCVIAWMCYACSCLWVYVLIVCCRD